MLLRPGGQWRKDCQGVLFAVAYVDDEAVAIALVIVFDFHQHARDLSVIAGGLDHADGQTAFGGIVIGNRAVGSLGSGYEVAHPWSRASAANATCPMTAFAASRVTDPKPHTTPTM